MLNVKKPRQFVLTMQVYLLPDENRCFDCESHLRKEIRPYFCSGARFYCSVCGVLLMSLEIEPSAEEVQRSKSKRSDYKTHTKPQDIEVVA